MGFCRALAEPSQVLVAAGAALCRHVAQKPQQWRPRLSDVSNISPQKADVTNILQMYPVWLLRYTPVLLLGSSLRACCVAVSFSSIVPVLVLGPTTMSKQIAAGPKARADVVQRRAGPAMPSDVVRRLEALEKASPANKRKGTDDDEPAGKKQKVYHIVVRVAKGIVGSYLSANGVRDVTSAVDYNVWLMLLVTCSGIPASAGWRSCSASTPCRPT